MNQQKKQLQEVQKQSLSSIAAEQMLEKVIKNAEMAMQNSILLQQEIHQLNTSNKYQKEKIEETQTFIQDWGSLTGAEGLQQME